MSKSWKSWLWCYNSSSHLFCYEMRFLYHAYDKRQKRDVEQCFTLWFSVNGRRYLIFHLLLNLGSFISIVVEEFSHHGLCRFRCALLQVSDRNVEFLDVEILPGNTDHDSSRNVRMTVTSMSVSYFDHQKENIVIFLVFGWRATLNMRNCIQDCWPVVDKYSIFPWTSNIVQKIIPTVMIKIRRNWGWSTENGTWISHQVQIVVSLLACSLTTCRYFEKASEQVSRKLLFSQ